MTIFCSVGHCSELGMWRFGHMRLCQHHWQEWCDFTWHALKANAGQPVMEDWITWVGVRDAAVLAV